MTGFCFYRPVEVHYGDLEKWWPEEQPVMSINESMHGGDK
jgi:hypothetical protein